MNRRICWDGASYKEWIGLLAAPVFWVASLVCFVLGLAFKQDTGIFISGISVDLTLLFSIGLGFANTAIQIVGNDTDKEDMGISLWLMWIASYMLGIGSNVNFLNQRVGLDSPILQGLVCWGLGVMIEVAPERLLVKFLRAIGILGDGSKTQQPQITRTHVPQQPKKPWHNEVRTPARPVLEHTRQSYPVQTGQNEKLRPERGGPTKDNHYIGASGINSNGGRKISSDEDDIPEFLRQRR